MTAARATSKRRCRRAGTILLFDRVSVNSRKGIRDSRVARDRLVWCCLGKQKSDAWLAGSSNLHKISLIFGEEDVPSRFERVSGHFRP